MTNTTISFQGVLLSFSQPISLTFFPGSISQGYITNDKTDLVQTFYFNGSQFTITSTWLTLSAGASVALPTGSPLSRIVVVTYASIYLYAACSLSGCAAGGCDYNGNCINGCTNSTPARTGTNCSCPSGYVDNGYDAQCELYYKPI